MPRLKITGETSANVQVKGEEKEGFGLWKKQQAIELGGIEKSTKCPPWKLSYFEIQPAIKLSAKASFAFETLDKDAPPNPDASEAGKYLNLTDLFFKDTIFKPNEGLEKGEGADGLKVAKSVEGEWAVSLPFKLFKYRGAEGTGELVLIKFDSHKPADEQLEVLELKGSIAWPLVKYSVQGQVTKRLKWSMELSGEVALELEVNPNKTKIALYVAKNFAPELAAAAPYVAATIIGVVVTILWTGVWETWLDGVELGELDDKRDALINSLVDTYWEGLMNDDRNQNPSNLDDVHREVFNMGQHEFHTQAKAVIDKGGDKQMVLSALRKYEKRIRYRAKRSAGPQVNLMMWDAWGKKNKRSGFFGGNSKNRETGWQIIMSNYRPRDANGSEDRSESVPVPTRPSDKGYDLYHKYD